MECSQVVRHRILVPTLKGSNPFTPGYLVFKKNFDVRLQKCYAGRTDIRSKFSLKTDVLNKNFIIA